MNKGDRVSHEYLGKGTFIEIVGYTEDLSLVKWDKTPDIRYNMGENPCVIWTSELKKLEECHD